MTNKYLDKTAGLKESLVNYGRNVSGANLKVARKAFQVADKSATSFKAKDMSGIKELKRRSDRLWSKASDVMKADDATRKTQLATAAGAGVAATGTGSAVAYGMKKEASENKYLEKLAFSRLSEASFKNLTQDEKAKVHHYITHEADNGRKATIAANTVAGASLGGLAGGIWKGKNKAAIIGAGVGAVAGALNGSRVADNRKTKNIDQTLNNANLASVLRQPIK